MITIKTLKCDLNKAIINIGFIGAVMTAMLLCFTADIYIDDSNGKAYSVFEAMFNLDKSIIAEKQELASINVFGQCLYGYITMFIPIIVAFPFMVTFCAERNSGLMRFAITRTGKTKYCLSKFFACCFSAGLAVMLGVALYGIVVKLSFPDITSYGAETELSRTVTIVIKMLASAFLYGAISVMPAFFLSSFCKNPYLITCVPFLLVYLWNAALNKAAISFSAAYRWEMIDKLTPCYPNSVFLGIMKEYDDNTGRNIAIFNTVYVLVLLTAFIIVMNSRKDKGV